MFPCVLVTFPYDILGQLCYLIVSIPDICLLPYFTYLWIRVGDPLLHRFPDSRRVLLLMLLQLFLVGVTS